MNHEYEENRSASFLVFQRACPISADLDADWHQRLADSSCQRTTVDESNAIETTAPHHADRTPLDPQPQQRPKGNVPADLDNPVTLTLLEVEAWQRPEHAFLRQLIQPGMRLLDADTGLGLDALAMAQGLNGAGQVTALNADPLFARSVADNGLQAVIQTPTAESNARPTSTRAGR